MINRYLRFAGSTAIAALATWSVACHGQTTPTPSDTPAPAGPASAVPPAGAAADAPGEVIVVTGSRIARPTLDSPIPVTSLSVGELVQRGQISVGDALNDLPQLRSTFSQSNSTRFIGTAGLNLLDLRGLGVSRTLVLVNGRRHITAQEGEFQIDTNTIPTDLIDRVDIVTGGSSAVYGSDAMAGVVNFVLKKNFEGITANAQGGVSSHGDRGSYRASATAGTNFSDGRGNVAVSLEYDQADTLYYTDRPTLTGAFGGRRQFQLVDDPSLDNTTPDRTFLNGGVRSFGYSNGGSFIAYNRTSIRSCAGGVAAACRPNGFPRVFLFQPDGTLRESAYGTDFRPVGSGNNLNGDGATLEDTGTLDPGYKRYVANVLAHYDFSDAFKPFLEAKYVRVDTFSQGGPTFAQGAGQGTLAGGAFASSAFASSKIGGIPIFFDNPYLLPSAAATIRSLLPAGSTFFRVNRNNVDFGTREEINHRDTFRAVVGVEGSFNDDWHYDVALNYGQYRSKSLFLNDRIEANFEKSVDAVRNATGQIVCRVNQVTITDPACVPVNVLGAGAPSQAALNYFMTTTNRLGHAKEYDATANVTGDSSQLFELPGGPIRFAIGGEYRRETADYAYDDLVSSGQTFQTAVAPFNPPSFVVKEAYGEIDIPLFRHTPFIDELSLNGAGRVARYKGSVGTVYAFNYGGIYSPIRDIKFRANYSRSVRAPTLGDLYSTASQNFASVDDPCDTNFINNGKANRPANCRAAGVPVGFQNPDTRAGTIAILSGGNPDLTSEKSRSITLGVIVQPRFLPGLAITADYYDVKITRVIASVDAQTILDGCYDAASLDNQFCQLIYPRNGDGTFQNPALLQASVNFAGERAKGLDVDISYNHRFDPDNKLVVHVVGNWVRERTDFPYIDNPTQPERVKGELGDPIYQVNFSADYTFKALTLGYQMRYIGRQSVTDWEAQHDTYGVPAYDPYYADRVYYPHVFYHAASFSLEANKHFTIYGGVDNITNKQPPLGILGTGSVGEADGIYDNIGRFFYTGIRVKL